MANHQRKEERYGVSMDVAQNDKSGRQIAKTADISRSGLFLCTSVLKPLRSLIQLSISLPHDPKPVSAMAQVAWLCEQPRPTRYGLQTGMGLKFFSMSGDDRRRWEKFLEAMRTGTLPPETMNQLTNTPAPQPLSPPSGVYSLDVPDLDDMEIDEELHKFEEGLDEFEIVIDEDFDGIEDVPVTDLSGEFNGLESDDLPSFEDALALEPDDAVLPPPTGGLPQWDQRQFQRRNAAFLVKMNDQQKLRQFFTVDISEGGMLLRSHEALPIGAVTELILIHPWTAEELPLYATVRRAEIQGGRTVGVGIEFNDQTEAHRDAVIAFIESGFNLVVPGAVNLIEGALLRIRKLEERIALNPIDSELHYGVGLLYLYLKEYGKAREHLDISRRLGFPIPRDIPIPR